jgi:hypothetical protein
MEAIMWGAVIAFGTIREVAAAEAAAVRGFLKGVFALK